MINYLRRLLLTWKLESQCRRLGLALSASSELLQKAEESITYAGDCGRRFKACADSGLLSESSHHWAKRSRYLTTASSQLHQAQQQYRQATTIHNRLLTIFKQLDRICSSSHPEQNKRVLAVLYVRSASRKFPALERQIQLTGEKLQELLKEAPDLNRADLTEPLLAATLQEIAAREELEKKAIRESHKLRKKRGGLFSFLLPKK